MQILICGTGAIGSNLTRYLVPDLRGNHDITVLDKDIVEERNVTAGTQFYTADQIGLSKVEALQFNIYKQFEREIEILNREVQKTTIIDYDLIIDCFDNYEARNYLQELWRGSLGHGTALLHIGFSDQFTFAIEWGQGYKVPTDITTGFDICEMQGAAAFVNRVASIGALVVENFIDKRIKMEIVGGKFDHRVIK